MLRLPAHAICLTSAPAAAVPQGLSDNQRQHLSDVPLVPVANCSRLVAPRRLFMRLRADLAPFAYEVPLALAPFSRLFKELGAADEPSAEQLVDALAAFKSQVGGVGGRGFVCCMLCLSDVLRVLSLQSMHLSLHVGSVTVAPACAHYMSTCFQPHTLSRKSSGCAQGPSPMPATATAGAPGRASQREPGAGSRPAAVTPGGASLSRQPCRHSVP
jgi:hypothetical protein